MFFLLEIETSSGSYIELGLNKLLIDFFWGVNDMSEKLQSKDINNRFIILKSKLVHFLLPSHLLYDNVYW